MSLVLRKFYRKSFPVEAVQVTAENMEEVCEWAKGTIAFDETDAKTRHIKIDVHQPLDDRQTRAYVTDWVLYAGRGFKIYRDGAFNKSFDEEGSSSNVFANMVIHSGGGGGNANPARIHGGSGGGANPGGTHIVQGK